MQTKQDIEKLLAGAGTTPNRRLGQNFLIDLNLMRFLLEAAHVHGPDVVLEVGCGTGSFTEELVAHAGHVVGVEYDPALYQITKKRLAKAGNLTLIQSDVLESKNTIAAPVLDALQAAGDGQSGHLLLAANLPYNVASSVMANLITGPLTADAMTVTVQKEVADRMTAVPDHEEYGPLSILMAATGTVRILKKLPPTVFWPRPQVDSAMIRFERDAARAAQIHDMDFFQQVIHLFMNHRRKMIKACVHFAEGDLEKVNRWPDVFEEAFVDPQLRPEELTPENYINIANLCYEQTR